MASKNVMIGTGAALAGLGGLAVAAVTTDQVETKSAAAANPPAPIVETQTVIVRKVEHRTVRVKPKHHRVRAAAPSVVRAAAPVPVVQAARTVSVVPVVHTAPVRTRTSGSKTTHSTAPIRTRTSGGHGGEGGDRGEHADD